MAFEIEIKARVEDPDKTKVALSALGKYLCAYHKRDSYWVFPDNRIGKLRIRDEEKTFPGKEPCHTILVTFKMREMHRETEVNKELEFSVSDSAVFGEILAHMGLQTEVLKTKHGWAWELGGNESGTPVLAELSNVGQLGWFLELEILSDTFDGQGIERNRSSLLALLEKLGIPRDRIETRPYTDLLLRK